MKYGRLPWLFGAIFIAMGLLAAVPGWWFLVTQHYRLATYVPVEARIVESRVIRGGHDGYEPVITYSYVVQGHRYESRRVSAIGNYSSSGTWAWEICSRLPVGGKATAWHSAGDPSSSFISREVIFTPHFAAILGFVFVLAGGWALVQTVLGRRVPEPPVRRRDGWFILRQEFSNRQAFRIAAAATVAWYSYLAIMFEDYLVLTNYQVNILGLISGAVAVGLGIIGLVQCRRYWKLCHDFSDAQVSADRERFQLGSAVRLRVEQGISRHLVIDELSLEAVCMVSNRLARSGQAGYAVTYTPAAAACNVQKRLTVNRDYPPGSQLSATCEFTLPAHAAASTPPRSSIFPISQWFIVLQVAAEGQPTLTVRFPIVVENGSGAPAATVRF